MVLKDYLTPLLCLAAGYFKAIASIAVQQKAKLYIPVSAPTTAIYDSLTQDVLPKDCMCWTLPPHLTGLLDDKTAFTDLCNKVRQITSIVTVCSNLLVWQITSCNRFGLVFSVHESMYPCV